jgi:hypothetical protein
LSLVASEPTGRVAVWTSARSQTRHTQTSIQRNKLKGAMVPKQEVRHREFATYRTDAEQLLTDPAKGAKVFYDLAVMDDPPMRCVVGTDAYSLINKKLDTYNDSIKKFEKWSNSTDVEGYKAPN